MKGTTRYFSMKGIPGDPDTLTNQASYRSASLAGSKMVLVQTQKMLHLSSTVPPTFELSSKTMLPYDPTSNTNELHYMHKRSAQIF